MREGRHVREKIFQLIYILENYPRDESFMQRMSMQRIVRAPLTSPTSLDHHRYIKEVLPVALRYGNSKLGNNYTFQQDNGVAHTHQETQECCCQQFPSFIDKDILPANSPNLNDLDNCIWDEFAQAINWNKVTWKSSLISELKYGVKKFRLYVVRESCSIWTNHLYRMAQNYFRE